MPDTLPVNSTDPPASITAGLGTVVIEQLAAFEDYSAQCEVNTKQDAALHGYLHQMTARARWLMEVALEKLAEVEQIEVPQTGNDRQRRQQ